MADIAPELLEKVMNSFKSKNENSKKLKELSEKLKNGEASYEDAYSYAKEIGNNLTSSFTENIKAEDLPDETMYYDIANRVVKEPMQEVYKEVADYTETLQKELNSQSGIQLQAIRPDINGDKINSIVNKVSSDTYENVKWILGAPVKHHAMGVVDDGVKANADFHYKTGMRPKIKRKLAGETCEWCRAVAGEYDYPDVPQDVYRRHDRCDCTVDYYPGNGKKQNVHNKQWQDLDEDDKIKERVKYSDSYKSYDILDVPKSSKVGKVIEAKEITINNQIYTVDGKLVIFDPSVEEREVAKWISTRFGVNVRLQPKVLFPEGIRTADYKIEGEGWDLKTISNHGKNTISSSVRKAKGQAENLILDLKDHTYTNKDLLKDMNRIFAGENYSFVRRIIVKEDDKLRGFFIRNKKR